MGHGTLVDGVQQLVTAGFDLVDGVQRKQTKGLALVDGVQREIRIKEPQYYKVRIGSYNYSSYFCYAKIGSTYLTSNSETEVLEGTEITCYVRTDVTQYPGTITLNGETVKQNGTYTLVVTGNTAIIYDVKTAYNNGYGVMTINVVSEDVSKETYTVKIGTMNGASATLNGTTCSSGTTLSAEGGSILEITGTAVSVDGVSHQGSAVYIVANDVSVSTTSWGVVTVTTG